LRYLRYLRLQLLHWLLGGQSRRLAIPEAKDLETQRTQIRAVGTLPNP
jgi:hypothetical protein